MWLLTMISFGCTLGFIFGYNLGFSPAIFLVAMPNISYNFHITGIEIVWHFNLTLVPWQDGFFEHLICIVKLLFKKQLKTYLFNYEQMQTLL